MPELPEVETFRRLLEPLISTEHVLRLERHSLDKAPPRRFLSDEEIDEIHSFRCVVSDVLRKGKLIGMVLTPRNDDKKKAPKNKYLMIHMGMTGRISNASHIPKLVELSDTTAYPPPHTYLKFVAGPYDACFSDPRKFGHVIVKDSMDEDFGALAPDAWTDVVTEVSGEMPAVDQDAVAKLAQQRLGIKALLLDQNRAVSGVGNYLADEVLYQIEMHPDQKYLSTQQAEALLRKLFVILDHAIHCNGKEEDFPKEWLFHYRWSKGKKENAAKDCHGRTVTFLTSGGRTSAIVPSLQKLKGQKGTAASETTNVSKKRVATGTATSTTTVKEVKTRREKPAAGRKRKSADATDQVDSPTKRGVRKSPRLSS